MNTLIIEIPKSCIYNVAIGKRDGEANQRIIGDTNNGSNWDNFSFPLPKGDWEIVTKSYDYKIITIKNK